MATKITLRKKVEKLEAKLADRENRLKLVEHYLRDAIDGLGGEPFRMMRFDGTNIVPLRRATNLRFACRPWKQEVDDFMKNPR